MDSTKVTTASLRRMKRAAERIAVLTAYDYPMAKILDRAGMDVILVGDSANNTVHGRPTTLSITMDQMIEHCRMVTSAVERALVVGDMPFMSFQVSPRDTLINAGRLMKEGGVEAVKLEGGGRYVGMVKRLVEAGIPVMGHLGLLPQSVHQLGGYRLQGRSPEAGAAILTEAKKLEDAGCFALVLEKVPAALAEEISKALTIPTIGIGAGAACDGQVLVLHDMLGLTDAPKLKFVRRYAELQQVIAEAIGHYIADVKAGEFPSKDESF